MTRPPFILVVEDNPRNLKLVRDVLDHVGYRTLVAEDGEQGVELAGAHRPDLTLMDVQLPGIDGVEALSRLRADPATARLRVAALTASVDEGGPGPPARGRFRRLSREADRCARVSRRRWRRCSNGRQRGSAMSDDGTILVVDDLPAEPAADGRRARAARLRRGARRPPARRRSSGWRAIRSTSSCSTSSCRASTGYEVCRRDPRRRGHALPARRHGHGERRHEKLRGDRGGRGRLRHQAVRPGGAAGPGALAGADQALPRHDRRSRPPSWPTGTASSRQRVAAQVDELERVGRLRRFLSPQLAELVVDSGDESFLQSHRREITVVFCDLRGFTAFAETAEPEEVMAVLARVPRGARAISSSASRARSSTSPATGSWSSSTTRCRAPTRRERAVRMAVAMREPVGELAEGWQRRGHDLGFGVGIAQGYATLGRIGFEGRYDYAAIGTRHQPRGPAVRARPRRARSS